MDSDMSLQGLRVLDLSRVLAGPWCTQMLGDLGADVLKVERPGAGDDTRHWGPPFDARSGDAAYYQCANRNKRSVCVDFGHPSGAALLQQLAMQCDVVVENFKPGSLARHGLAAEQLLERQPRLVICSISGFGHSGPLRERAGYDFVVQAMGGLMSVTGPAADEAGSGPCKVGVAVADLYTGMHAVVGILAALRHRDRTGKGQHLDLSLFDCQLSMLANLGSQWLAGGAEPKRMGNAHPTIAPYESLPTAEGDLVLAVGNDGQFQRLCDALASSGVGPRPAVQVQRGSTREPFGIAPRTDCHSGFCALRPLADQVGRGWRACRGRAQCSRSLEPCSGPGTRDAATPGSDAAGRAAGCRKPPEAVGDAGAQPAPAPAPRGAHLDGTVRLGNS
jgi:crotonobetainyl-CoA:carnitine CoA-transferase CaiB-like acyl-CoA transferase